MCRAVRLANPKSIAISDFKHIREGLLEGRMPPIDFHEIISLIAPRP